jgi:hypothetical protein
MLTMRQASTPSLLYRLLHPARRPEASDFGDMGTAFGMEMTLSGHSHIDEGSSSFEPVVRRSWVARMFSARLAR